MRSNSWSQREINYLRSRYGKKNTRAIAKHLGRTYASVKSTVKRLGLITGKHRPWTPKERKLVKLLYADHSTTEIAAQLNRTVLSVYQQAEKFGLKKSQEYMDSPAAYRLRRGDEVGKAFRFPKGHVPANKGLRRPGYGPGRMKQTQFKKGNRTWNSKPIGTIQVDTDGYLRIKVRDPLPGEATGNGNTKSWPLLQRYVWEQAHGPIPDGHVVIFKDRNRANCDINNLDCISQEENMRRNSLWNRFPYELATTIQLVGALKRKIRRKEKDNGSKK